MVTSKDKNNKDENFFSSYDAGVVLMINIDDSQQDLLFWSSLTIHNFTASAFSLSLSLSGVHIFQRMNGCEWDDETDKITGFNQYGYDGEDFIALDLQTLTWIAPKPQAVVTKLQWDTEKPRLEHNKNYYINRCPDWLKKYVKYGRRFLQRTGRITYAIIFRCKSFPFCFYSTAPFQGKWTSA